MKKLLEKLIYKLNKQSYLNSLLLSKLKRHTAEKTGFFPKNSELLAVLRHLVKKGKIKKNEKLENFLKIKKIRSLSGIVPLAVFTKPYNCKGNCLYCPRQKNIPHSYLDNEPAVMRAIKLNYDPYLQVRKRIEQLEATGHDCQKIELIVMGGSFNALPKKYQINFIAQCFLAANKQKKPSKIITSLKKLTQIQKKNENAFHRIIGLTLETRPDLINIKEIAFIRKLGATRIELGVQSVFLKILKKVDRGHNIQTVIKATKLLKDTGFKINYHLMPNLPGSTLKKDFLSFQKVFNSQLYRPDMVKIYPCVVCWQAPLYKWYKKGKFKPYSDKSLVSLLLKIKKIVPPWVRIMRLGRDIPAANIAAGCKLSNIRQILQQIMKKRDSSVSVSAVGKLKTINLILKN